MGQRYGRYETIQPIASGGMATVHLARSVGEGGFERLVALKVMHPHIASDPGFRGMFLDEARLAARIRHPNVVGVLDIQTAPESMFLVMDYVDGPSLHQLRRAFAKNSTTMPLGVVLRVFIDTLTGLQAAHELHGKDGQPLHLVHRDVSPQNILVGKDGVTRLTDFGVARAEARITSTRGGQLKGKIAYMASEQIHDAAIDGRADLYGVGVALWEALTGQRLFRADNEAGLIQKILGGVGAAPHEVNQDVPVPISDVCMQALSLDREARPQTSAEFADTLEAAATRSFVDVASQRHVAAFVRSLPDELLEIPASPHPIESGPTVDDRPIVPASIQAMTWHEGRDEPGTSSFTAPNAMVASTQPTAGSSKTKLVVVALSAALVTGLAAWLILPRAPPNAGADPMVTSRPGAVASSSPKPEPTVAVTPSAALSAAPTDAASAPTDAVSAPTDAVSASAAPSTVAKARAIPPPRVPRPPTKPPAPTAPPQPTRRPGFLPKDL